MYEFLRYRVDDVMTRKVVVVSPKATLQEAEQIFEEHDFNGLPVVDDDGTLVGWMTKLDLLSAFRADDEHMFLPYEEIMQKPVSSVMTRQVRSVTPMAHLTDVLEKLVSGHNKSFPVVDTGRLIGVVAREDVLRGLRKATEEDAPKP